MREPKAEAAVTITYKIARGPRYVVDAVAITGNTAVPTIELVKLLQVEVGEPYVQAAAGAGAAAIRNVYRARGFTRVDVRTTVTELPREDDAAPGIDRHVDVRYTVTEGPRTLVGSIGFAGNTLLAESQLRALMTTAPGRPYSEGEIAVDRDRIDLEYRNRGYESVVVTPVIELADNATRADVRFEITEGPQVLVDHVIIIGNQRTSTQTIEREVLLKPGEPLGTPRASKRSSVWPRLVFFAASRWTNCATAARHGATC